MRCLPILAVLLLTACSLIPTQPTPTPAVPELTALETLRKFMPLLRERYPAGRVVAMGRDTAPDPARRRPGWSAEMVVPGEQSNPVIWLVPAPQPKRLGIAAVGRPVVKGEQVADLQTGEIAPLIDSDEILREAEAALGVPERLRPKTVDLQLNGSARFTCDRAVTLPAATRLGVASTCERLGESNVWSVTAVDSATRADITVVFDAQSGDLLAVLTSPAAPPDFAPLGWTCQVLSVGVQLGCVPRTG